MEPSLLDAIKHSPGFYLIIIMFSGVGIVIGASTIFAGIKRWEHTAKVAAAGLVDCIIILMFGWAFRAMSRGTVDEVLSIPGLAASERSQLAAFGYAEADMVFSFAVAAIVLPLAMCLIGFIIGKSGSSSTAASKA